MRAGTTARALAPWGESGVRVGVKADVASLSRAVHWHQPYSYINYSPNYSVTIPVKHNGANYSQGI